MASSLSSYLGDHSDCFAFFGTVAVAYLSLKFLCSVWRGVKVYILSGFLGLGTDLKKFGSWAVVTGSTDGIGKGYAHELAKKGINIVLVSRSPEKLNDVAQEIAQKYKVETKTVAIDFGKGPEIYEKLRKELAGMDIGVLVNNVGMSYEYPQYFLEVKDDKVIQNILNVNAQSMLMVTRVVLPMMVEKKKGVVINISSGSALCPTPLLTVYSATKAFVDFFSQGLSSEYKSKGIIVQGVLPFFVATKLSKIRRSSIFIPNPFTYAKSALGTVGVEDRTFGFWTHAMQAYLLSFIPVCLQIPVSKMIMQSARKAALKKIQKKQ